MNPSPALPPSSIAPPTLLLPRSGLFAARARRLRQLAPGHALGDWLLTLASLCEAQHHLDDTGSPTLPGLSATGPAVGALSSAAAQASLLAALPHELDRLGAALAQGPASALATRLAQGLAPLSPPQLAARGQAVLAWAAGHAPATAREPLDVLLGAALQTLASRHLRGRSLPVALSPLPGPQSCPCCGSAAHGGLVMIANGQAGLRYLECSLCGSRWHAVRARCTLCDDPHETTYHGLHGHHPGALAETCDGCHGYVKTFFMDKDPQVEPLADDLATLALDVLVGEGGHGRASPHLFLLEGEGLGA